MVKNSHLIKIMTCHLPNSPSLHIVQKTPTWGTTVPDPPRPAWASSRSPSPAFPGVSGLPRPSRGPKSTPTGPRRGLWPAVFSLLRLGSSACGRRNGRPASQRQRAPRREYGPRDLTRPGPSSRGSSSGHRGLHDTAPSCPGSDPGPARARPRGRAGAQPGPRPSHSPLASPSVSLPPGLDSDAARPGLPSTAGPTVRAPAAGGRARAYTYSAPEAMARASPGRRLWRPEGNGYENGR